MDIAYKQDETLAFKILVEGADLKTDKGLRTAIIISLFTDHLIGADEQAPDGTDNRRGYWGDDFADVAGDLTGSLLWTLSRRKQTNEALQTGREYAEQALQWMLIDGVARNIEVETQWVKSGVMGIMVRVFKANNEPFEQTFEYSLEAF